MGINQLLKSHLIAILPVPSSAGRDLANASFKDFKHICLSKLTVLRDFSEQRHFFRSEKKKKEKKTLQGCFGRQLGTTRTSVKRTDHRGH